MATKFFVRRHNVDGEMYLEREGDFVNFYCRWPFDTSTNEWIDIRNRFRLLDYVREVRALSERRSATVMGVDSGLISFKLDSRGKIRVHAMDAARHEPPSFYTSLDAKPEQLLPVEEGLTTGAKTETTPS
jgi:hypothetical protein